MDSDQEKLKSLLQRLGDPGAAPLNDQETQWLKDFKSRYPFFTLPETSGATREPSLRDVVTAPSRHALARMHGREEASRFDGFYPVGKGPATPTTSAAIDDFLNTYGHQSQEEDTLLERLIFNPIPDYAQQLAREEEADLPELPAATGSPVGDGGHNRPASPEERLNRFILTHREGQPRIPVSRPEEHAVKPIQTPAQAAVAPTPQTPRKNTQSAPPDGLLSESLAKIYIKTRRYQQAYEILNGLSLRFPEKSRYFADQLRFLRKLILNQQRSRVENNTENNPNP